MIWASVKPRAGVVNNPVRAVDERHVLRVVTHLFFRDPTIDVRLADPHAINAERVISGRGWFAPTYEALVLRRVVWKGRASGRRKFVRSLNIKCGQRARDL